MPEPGLILWLEIGNQPDEASARSKQNRLPDVPAGWGQAQHHTRSHQIAAACDQISTLERLEQTRERRRADPQLRRHVTSRPLAIGQRTEHPQLLQG